jgi:hypothetical protein
LEGAWEIDSAAEGDFSIQFGKKVPGTFVEGMSMM